MCLVPYVVLLRLMLLTICCTGACPCYPHRKTCSTASCPSQCAHTFPLLLLLLLLLLVAT
jgi:hypothetical protein